MLVKFNLFSSPVDNYVFLITTGFFIIFLVYVIAARVTAEANYYSIFIKRHLQFAVLYLFFSSFYIFIQFGFSLNNLCRILIGLFLFFLYQYGFIFLLVNAMKKSVSMNLLVTLHQKGGSLTFAELDQSHANDKGMEFVTEDRINQLIATQCIILKDDYFYVSPKGEFILKSFNLFLRIFGLSRFL